MPAALRTRRGPRTSGEYDDSSTDAGMSDSSTKVEKPKPAAGHSKGENKASKMKKRLIFGSLLLVALCMIIAAGHFWTLGLVLFVQVSMFRELVNVRYSNRSKLADVPLFRTSQWVWFFSCLLYSYGRSFNEPERRGLITSKLILSILPYVEFTSLLLYSIMLMFTVLTLTKGYYKYQVGQLAWTVAIIVITVVQVHSFTGNVLNGLFWFLFPVSLVICNDSMAYFCGMAYGRKIVNKTFLELSPNKTWEGFIGGGICTVLFAFLTPWVYTKLPFLICPCENLKLFSFETLQLTCTTPPVFVPTQYTLTWLASVVPGASPPTLTLLPIQLHALCLGTFASVVAPFGGFFASGIKRAYKLDDFASIIPGHGGVFDRVDCQLIMGLATQTYYATFIGGTYTVARLLELAATLGADDQLALYNQLGKALRAQGLAR